MALPCYSGAQVIPAPGVIDHGERASATTRVTVEALRGMA
jgi:hypothetical protein